MYLMITRYYSDDEMEQKGLQVPTETLLQHVNHKRSGENDGRGTQMMFGLPVDFKVCLYNENYLALDSESMTCHMRKYLINKFKKVVYLYTSALQVETRTRMGVAIRPEELQAIYTKLSVMYRELRDDSQSYIILVIQ